MNIGNLLGNIVAPLPMAAGRAIGGKRFSASDLVGGNKLWMGQKPKETQTQLYNPEQQQAMSQMLQQALSGLSGNQFDFAPIEQQAKERFSSETVPGLAERFTSMGTGANRSSAFQGALGAAGANLNTDLAALKSQYGLQQQGNLMNMLNMGLQRQFEPNYMGGKPGILGPMLGQVGQFAGQNYARNSGNLGQDQQGGGGDFMAMLMKFLPMLLAA